MLDSERDRIFGDWLAAHKGILFKVVHAYGFEHADRQDLFQEIVFQVWRSVDAFRGESSVPTWVYRVALNTAIGWTRKQDRHHRGKQPLDVVDGLLTTSPDGARSCARSGSTARLRSSRTSIPSVALLLLDGFSYKEIAAIVGLTESNVGVKINRIKSALVGKRAEENGIMNLDDLMAVWKSQDAAPLHGVNQTLLHLALRQDEAKLQKERRRERWIDSMSSARMVAAMALFLAMMIHFHRHRPEKVVTGWDYVLPILGAAAALLAVAMYVGHRAQAWREQRFGESLRDSATQPGVSRSSKIRARIARETLVSVLLWGICPTAILLLIHRINDKSISDDGDAVTLTFILVWSVANSVWWYRRRLQRDASPESAGWRRC